MPMHVLARFRRVPGVVVAMLAIAAVMVMSQPARSYTGNLGYIKVTATPTVGLTDGQAVNVHLQAPSDLTIFDVQAHLCQAGAGIKNGFEFDLDGPYCSPSRVSPSADAVVEQKANSTTADFVFHVGAGTGAPWAETDGGTHSLTCGVGAPCDLVVQVAVSGQNAYHAIPLCFGDACGPEPGSPSDSPVPAAAAAGGSTGSTTSGQSPGNSAGSGASAVGGPNVVGGSAPDGAAATKDAKSAVGSHQAADSRTSSASDERALGVTGSSSGSSTAVATWRVVLAGLAGLLCGARIVSVVGRARRPRVGIA
jgi:hypothetical protein